jgi:ABC-three component (ABC-3C) system Middle Component 3
MGVLSREVRAIQNPALGAVALWSFAEEYFDASPTHKGPPLQLLFIVLPIVFDEDIRGAAVGTRKSSGLRAFTEKLAASRVAKSDRILALQSRVTNYRGLTIDSLRFLLRAKMGSIDTPTGQLIPSKTRGLKQQVPESVEPILKAARNLGHWTSAISLYETAVTLRLSF